MAEEPVKNGPEIKIGPANSGQDQTAPASNLEKTSNYSAVIVIALIIFLAIGGYFLFQKAQKEKAVVPDNQAVTGQADESAGFKSAQTGVDEIALAVTYPNRDLTVATESLTVSGVTEPGAEVSVNDREIIADSDGKFSVKLDLVEGENYVTVVAVNSEGKVAEAERIVTYEPMTEEE